MTMPSASCAVPAGTNSGTGRFAGCRATEASRPSRSCRRLEADEGLYLFGVLDVEDRHVVLFGDVDLLRVIDDALQVLRQAAGRVEADHDDVIAVVVGDAGQKRLLRLDLDADLRSGDFDGRLEGRQVATEVVEVTPPLSPRKLARGASHERQCRSISLAGKCRGAQEAKGCGLR